MLLALVALLIHVPFIGGQFVYDDFDVIVRNRAMGLWEKAPLLFTPEYFRTARELSYRPVVTLSYFVNHAVGGLDATVFHATDKLLHMVNVVLLYFLLGRLLGDGLVAELAAMLFAVHPVTTEALGAPAFREDPLALGFLLAGGLCYVRFRDAEGGGRGRWLWACAAALALQLALFSKEIALVAPGLVLLFDWALSRREDRPVGLHGAWVRAGVVLVLVCPYLALRFGPLRRPVESRIPYLGGSFAMMLLAAPGVVADSVRLLFVPIPLAAEYDAAALARADGLRLLAAAAVLAPAAALLVAGGRRSTAVGLAGGWMFLFILPVSSVVPIANPLAERFLYGPEVGACLLLGAGFAAVLRWARAGPARTWCACVCAACGVVLAVMTMSRSGVWLTERRLYRDTLRKCPTSQRFHVNLGVVYMGAERGALAEEEFARAVVLEPIPAEAFRRDHYRAECFFRLGNALDKQKKHGTAIAAFKECLTLAPEHAMAHHQIAGAYAGLAHQQSKGSRTWFRLYEKSLHHFTRAAELAPRYGRARRNLREMESFLKGQRRKRATP